LFDFDDGVVDFVGVDVTFVDDGGCVGLGGVVGD